MLRRKAGRRWPGSLRRLVGQFQHFCKVYADLLGEGYSGSSEARSDFHFDFVPSVLRDLEGWANESAEGDLAAAVSSTRRRYDDYLSNWEPHEL